jgi:alkylation response protein AidB-like acyl-CoA dehydrogenase
MPRVPRTARPLTEEQADAVRLARDFAAAEIRPRAGEVDEADHLLPREIWARAAGTGLTSFMIPEAYGGGGVADLVTQCLVQEELCHGDIAIGNLVTSNGFFAAPVLELGTEEQRKRFLTPLCSADPPLTALATTEPGVGSDAAAITTRAVRDGAHYVLTGQKSWISNAQFAGYFVIFATVAPGTRSKGITAFVLERGTAGLTIGNPMPKIAELYDTGASVTEEAAIAKLTASENAMWCTWAAVQTHGGWGYSREFLVEKWMRDAKLEEIEEGTSDIQRLIISRSLART